MGNIGMETIPIHNEEECDDDLGSIKAVQT